MSYANKLDVGVVERVDDLLSQPDSNFTTRTGLKLQMEMVQTLYKSHNELIELLREQNGRIGKGETEVAHLKKHNILLWIKENKGRSLGLLFGVFALNSVVNWQGIRKPLLHWAFKLVGLDVPMDLIP